MKKVFALALAAALLLCEVLPLPASDEEPL